MVPVLEADKLATVYGDAVQNNCAALPVGVVGVVVTVTATASLVVDSHPLTV